VTGLSCVGIAERRGQPLRRLKRWLLTEELPRARKCLRTILHLELENPSLGVRGGRSLVSEMLARASSAR
jgi:hypothetical protein